MPGAPLTSIGWDLIPPDTDPRVYKRVDLGSGPRDRTPAGFLRVDRDPRVEPDVVWDLDRFPWPFEDSSMHEVRSSHLLEHVVDVVGFFGELYRVCAPGAAVAITIPYYTHANAWSDPTHKRAITEASFQYFSAFGRKIASVEFYPPEISTVDFDVEKIQHVMEPQYEALADEARLYALRHYWNTCLEIQVSLRCYKPGRKLP